MIGPMMNSQCRCTVLLRPLLLVLFLSGFLLPHPASAEPQGQLLYTLHIPFEVGAPAEVRLPDGSAVPCGKVRVLPWKTKYPGFTASRYGVGGEVVATAANAHHFLIDVEGNRGRTLSLIPTATFVATAGLGSCLVVEGTGGMGLWGRYAPTVGSPVYVVNAIGSRIRFRSPDLLKVAKALEVEVFVPETAVDYLQIENRVGGRAWYHDGSGDHLFGLVDRPVSGTGRFSGTLYQDASRVRANHLGVLCVSTTPAGDIGGFQIVPRNHTFSPELQETQRMNQWLILRGPDFEDLTGKFPFFSGAVRPADREVAEGAHQGWVLCREGAGPWVPLPVVSDRTEDGLAKVTELRILLH